MEYSDDYKNCLKETRINEGFYSNRINDKGKETFIGISRVFHPEWDGWKIIDQYKKLPDFPNNLKKVEYLQLLVDLFYYNEFWIKLNCHRIDSKKIKFAVFDFGVNVGVYDCTKVIQETLNISIDGIFGEKTIFAINQYPSELFLEKFDLEKIERYCEIVQRDSSQMDNFYGWVCRVINNRKNNEN